MDANRCASFRAPHHSSVRDAGSIPDCAAHPPDEHRLDESIGANMRERAAAAPLIQSCREMILFESMRGDAVAESRGGHFFAFDTLACSTFR